MITKAISNLRPTASFSVADEDYSKIVWNSSDVDMPSEAEVNAEVARLQAAYDTQAYARNRAKEYPPIGDQLDALWKGGEAAAAMLAQVQAVKAKYPKPE